MYHKPKYTITFDHCRVLEYLDFKKVLFLRKNKINIEFKLLRNKNEIKLKLRKFKKIFENVNFSNFKITFTIIIAF